MSLIDFKNDIKQLVDSTDNELLLKHWKKQLQWDVEHQSEIELSNEEWNLVREGQADYETGNIISFEEFISKRK